MNQIFVTLCALAVGGGIPISLLRMSDQASRSAYTQDFIGVSDAIRAVSGNVAGKDRARVVVPATKVVSLRIKGMTCGGCVFAVRKVLTRLAGVTTAEVSYEKGLAVVTYDPARVTTSQMIAAIETLGYSAAIDQSTTGT